MRMRALDGWRGVVALLVMIFHMRLTYEIGGLGGVFSNRFWLHLQPVLDFFFICSGFVLGLIYGRGVQTPTDVMRFVFLRAARLWPLHLIILTGYVALEAARDGLWASGLLHSGPIPFTGMNAPGGILPQAALLHGFHPEAAITWNYPSWTLSTELAAYLTLAVILFAVKSTSWRLACGVLLSAVAGYAFHQQSQGWTAIHEISLYRCLMGFFLGYVLQMAWTRWPVTSRALGSALEIASVAGVLAILAVGVKGPWYLLSPALFALVIYTFASGRGVVSALLDKGPLPWLGDRSFSIYLLHVPMIALGGFALVILNKATGVQIGIADTLGRVTGLDAPWKVDLFMVAHLAVVIAGATLVYRWFEEPFRKQSTVDARRLFGGRKPVVLQDPNAPLGQS